MIDRESRQHSPVDHRSAERFLSPEGARWSLVGENVTENKTVENIEEVMPLPKFNYPNNPPGMLRDLRKIDLIKTLKHKFSAKVRRLFRQFLDTLPPGALAPDFTLHTVSGEKVSLSDYRGKKHVVVEFGSFN